MKIRMDRLFLFFAFLALVVGGQAEANKKYFSLFHRPEEIESKRQDYQKERALEDPQRIHLSGLLYQSPQNWQIWINGCRFSEKKWPSLSILKVTPDAVSFEVKQKGASLVFTLAPNQYYSLRDYKVGTGSP